VTHEIARRLVDQGDKVEWFSGSYPGARAEETLGGIRFIREGRQWSVHARAFRRYRGRVEDEFDVVVDQINTIPFFTPMWARMPIVAFIHQLAREIWWYESRFPVSGLGYLAEPLYLRVYRNVRVTTVSSSTRDDLRRLGFSGPITIIPEGLEELTHTDGPKSYDTPVFLYVGRLAPSKRVADLIKAIAIFNLSGGNGRLNLVGEGSQRYVDHLKRLASQLGIVDRVTFLGRLPVDEKHQLMASAHILLLASVREGWGLVVTEANAFGTPAIAYDVPGLRDSIRREQTGLLVAPNPDALAHAMRRLWTDRSLYRRLSDSAREWSRTFTFGETARAFRSELVAALGDKAGNTQTDSKSAGKKL
jgi:glycosyltransferase involved in cell wall biosynthesis